MIKANNYQRHQNFAVRPTLFNHTNKKLYTILSYPQITYYTVNIKQFFFSLLLYYTFY